MSKDKTSKIITKDRFDSNNEAEKDNINVDKTGTRRYIADKIVDDFSIRRTNCTVYANTGIQPV